MEQVFCKKNMGAREIKYVLQVLRKMIATRFEKKAGFSKREKAFLFKVWY